MSGFHHRTALTLAASALLALPALSQSQIPAMQEAVPLSYSCGGIGEDESTAMRAAMKSYPLSLLFAEKSGAYLASVKVNVRSPKVSSQFTANGPVCLIKLPAGSYQITATTKDGNSQTQSVQIGKSPRQLDFRY